MIIDCRVVEISDQIRTMYFYPLVNIHGLKRNYQFDCKSVIDIAMSRYYGYLACFMILIIGISIYTPRFLNVWLDTTYVTICVFLVQIPIVVTEFHLLHDAN